MAVLVEGISVIVRRKSIDSKLTGGWDRFVALVPNATLCTDGDLVRVGFMSPTDTQQFVSCLEQGGLCYLANGRRQDIAVVDQIRGPVTPVDWLENALVSIGESGSEVAACWLMEGSRIAVGTHLPGDNFNLATPEGWHYDGSLSAKTTFVPSDQMRSRLRFLRKEGNIGFFSDSSTGKVVHGGINQDQPVDEPANKSAGATAIPDNPRANAYRQVAEQQFNRMLIWIALAVAVSFFYGWWALVPGILVLRSIALCMISLSREDKLRRDD